MGAAKLTAKYPHIQFKRHWDVSPETHFQLGECGAMIDAICFAPLQPEYRKKLLNVSLVKGAQATTAIEGNTLTESEVAEVARGQSLPPSKEYQEREVRNILDAMNAILREVAGEGKTRLVTADLILRFHRLVGKELGEHFDAIPGRFRQDDRLVGPYRCPAHEDVPALVQNLCEWLQREFAFGSGRQTFADAVIQAIVTHVYLEWVHPFGDGNGRTGRLLEFYILLRAGNPDLASHILSNFYNSTRPEYYRQLDKACKDQDLTSFIAYAVQGYRDGLRESLHTIQENQLRYAWRGLIYDRFAEMPYRKRTVFKRRRSLMLNMPIGQELEVSALAILTPELARDYASATERTLLRDLAVLEEMDLIVRLPNGRVRANTSLLRVQLPARHQRVAGAPPES
jgi:Fic family protein